MPQIAPTHALVKWFLGGQAHQSKLMDLSDKHDKEWFDWFVEDCQGHHHPEVSLKITYLSKMSEEIIKPTNPWPLEEVI